MAFKDRLKGAALKSAELAKQGAEAAKEHRTDRQTAKAEEAARTILPPPPAAAAPSGLVFEAKSHEEGRNSTVQVFEDRIERHRDRARTSLSRARQDAEVIPLRSVASVQAKKDGLVYTKVTVYASGNTIEFRLRHDEAQRMKDEITKLLLAGGSPAPAEVVAPSVADRVRELAQLRDEGLLSEDEFSAQKAKLLNS